jgi:hypothetical protein
VLPSARRWASRGLAPSLAQESLWAFSSLLAERLDAGQITLAEARFPLQDYQRRLELEAAQLDAAQDAADAAQLGNALSVWRHYFPNR